ncbi:Retrovirus-related Pol polyprotein from transposon 412-like Protein [Tribolium castaneum]|uniref:RNA-directed DNA polymerase n=1 Tax=Tribolium castaneum TaxID=7070 RepID=D6WQK0_TRICA|nr:Retrovirus-related Pol polyprotein from transposon 412-like Protein [Tribolium castaneum]
MRSAILPSLYCGSINSKILQDDWYKDLIRKVTSSPNEYPKWCVRNEKLYKLARSGPCSSNPDSEWKLVVPKSCREAVLIEQHDEPTAGHLGYFKTKKRVAALYYWPKMGADIARYVRRCEVCQSQKPEQRPPYGKMVRREVSQPWELVCTDLMGPFPRSKKGNRFILIVADCFTKYVLLFALKSATSKEVAYHLENDLFLVYGVPNLIICDNGKQYVSKKVKDMVASYESNITFNPNYHPQANPSERINRVAKTAIRCYLKDSTHQEWDANLSKVGFALRTAVHEVTGYSPAYLNFGRELFLSGKLHKIFQTNEKGDVIDFAGRDSLACHVKELQQLCDIVKMRLDQAYAHSARRYNLRTRPLSLEKGQLVWKRNYVLSKAGDNFAAGLTPKFVKCIVHRRVTSNVYELLDFESRKNLGSWHVKDLKLNRGDD